MTTHKHHIIPKHMGGTDDPDNFVELTVEEHAEAHRKLYEEHGLLQDKLAWKGLSGLISTQEIVYTLLSEGRKGALNPMYGKPAANRGVKRPGVGGRKKGSKWSAAERASKALMRESKEHKDKMAAVYSDPKRNKKISEGKMGSVGAAAGKKWYNNGTTEKYAAEPIPEWQCGRLKRK